MSAVDNYVTNPWANPTIGGPNQLGSITGIDALDGLLRGWIAVEQVKTVKAMNNAQQQTETRTTVERPQHVGAQPAPPSSYTVPASVPFVGGTTLAGPVLLALAAGALFWVVR